MPKKIREFWLVGEKRSASIDTMNFEVEIFDAGIVPVYNDFGTFRLITKEGDSHKPSVKKQEPLKEQLIHFINCIENDLEPINSGEVGLRATKMAEAALLSAKLKKTVVFDKNGRAQ
jgi:predicted dehydrogenase